MMSNDKPLKQILLRKSSEFFKHSTLHGLYYLYGNTNRWVCIFWGLTLASSVGLWGFLSHMIWNKFIIDPTFIVVETTHYPTGKIPFPAVSICDTEMVYGPNTHAVKEILRLRGYEEEQINEFLRSITDVKHKGYTVTPAVARIHHVLESLGYTYNILLDLFKKPCDKLMEECVWRAKPINCTKMFRHRLTFVGYCCQFDLSYFKTQADSDTNFAASTDITEALDVTLNTDIVDSGGLTTDGYVSLYVFDGNDDITVLDSATSVTPATYYDVTLTVWLIESSPDAKALSLESRRCFLGTDEVPGGASHRNCVTSSVMGTVVESCRCLPFDYSHEALKTDDLPPCSWSRIGCVYETLDGVQGNVRDVHVYGNCFQNCDHVQYETEVEYMKHERAVSGKRVNSRVTIHFEDSSCMKYRREVLYTWDQMLANLGGVFGLCLGGSIVSIIEILWFLADLMKACLVKTKRRPVPNGERETKKKIHVTSHIQPKKVARSTVQFDLCPRRRSSHDCTSPHADNTLLDSAQPH